MVTLELRKVKLMKIRKTYYGMVLACVTALNMLFPTGIFASGTSINDALEALDLNTLIENGDYEKGFALPWESDDGTVSISWKSSDETAAIIAGNIGYIARGAVDKSVKITATAQKNGASAEKTFDITIPKAEYSGEYFINENFQNTYIDSLPTGFAVDTKFMSVNGSLATPDHGKWYFGVIKDEENEDEKYLKILRKANTDMWTNNGGLPCVYAVMSNAPKNGALVIEYRYKMNGMTSGDMISPWFTDADTSTLGTQYHRISNTPNGTSQYYHIWNTTTDKLTENVGSWNSAVIEATVSEKASDGQKMNYYHNGKAVATNFKPNRSEATYIKNMMFGWDTNQTKGAELFVDDVKVYFNAAKAAAVKISAADIGISDGSRITDDIDFAAGTTVVKNAAGDTAEVKLRYVSDKPGVISDSGRVKRPVFGASSEKVKLYVIAECDGLSEIGSVEVEVLPEITANVERTEITSGEDISCVIENACDEEKNVRIFALSYASDGTLVGCSQNTTVVTRAGEKETAALTYTAPANAHTVKVVLWNDSTLIPEFFVAGNMTVGK